MVWRQIDNTFTQYTYKDALYGLEVMIYLARVVWKWSDGAPFRYIDCNDQYQYQICPK